MYVARYLLLGPALTILASLAGAQNSVQAKTSELTQTGDAIKNARPIEVADSAPDRAALPGASSDSVSVPVPFVHAASATPTKNPTFDNDGTGVYVLDTRPRLELETRLNLNGGGFQVVSASMTGGVGMEQRHLSWHAYGTYNAARKTNDGTGPNPHGNIRSLGGELFYRTGSRWLFGGEYGYGSLRTTNYSKIGRGYDFGGGRDFSVAQTSMRLIVTYALPSGAYRQSGLNAHFMLPSPLSGGHFFFDERFSAGWLKAGPFGHYAHDASVSFGLLVRY
jgi:hypothetical protein